MQFLTSLALFVLLLVGGAAPARAEGLMLVELFSSKNCRSCPAAHRNLAALAAARSDLLVLTWSVDYWDYLGGKDTMALPESKQRQRGYVEHFSLRGPYTPQTVFAGSEHAPGNRTARVETALAKAEALPVSSVAIVRQNGRTSLNGDPGGLADVWWISYLSAADNTTDMVNPVKGVRQIGPWLGGRADIDLPACESACALVVQEAGFGRILSVKAMR